MSPLLKEYLNKKVVIVTTEGQCVIGTLEGFDKSTNLLLSSVYERFAKPEDITSQVQILRGSEVVLCGLYDDKADLFGGTGGNVPSLKDTKNKVKDEHLIWFKVGRSK
ncbi:hypothetical protein KAFR_0E01990 [Kazachstania africana CBS 2517]|uniref:LSM2-LSM8 complex subunit LSM8 n=1 Tax=Kazachstania africana (strain ATCC 22294 / BCRC 22015 / CBS 2517 / CECT 1963 / NBRC 1671 / NRRL Y-8276) TaxID=1071382 RepID=H2AVF2_KAZAF|nr:hypothetical protein KAFR_0E01990 [Kazachstania africana CBS 2517]CCF58352.1 hypothetical protein KAFR_0E01990 [Kazachstania africana CBS 2517]